MLTSISANRLPKFLLGAMLATTLCVSYPHAGHASPVDPAPATTEVTRDAAPALFIPVPARQKAQADAVVSTVTDRQVVRSRSVNIDLTLLTASADSSAHSSGKSAISLNLFDDVNFIAEADQIERSPRGTIWNGHLRGIEMSSVVLVINGDVVAGNIAMPEGRYHIRFAGDGVHEVQKIDQSLFPPDEKSMPFPSEDLLKTIADKNAAADESAQADDGATVDVMVVYSPKVRTTAGGTAAMRTLIDLAVAETNQSYQNSGVTQRVRLVHSEEVAYTETGNLEDALNCITSPSDGCLDNVHTLRNTYGADLVSFWVENNDGCGLGWLMMSVTPAFESLGFNTVARDCATGNYSFGHELGHNMGARHDVYVDPKTTPYPYAHGYVNTQAQVPWRTIMAYNDACAAVGKNCNRLQYWSNPSINYGGAPMGNSATADDHRVLNNTVSTVANFRKAVATTAPYQGLWWNANESGWGMSVTQHGSTIFSAFYTYDASGQPVWYVMSDCPLSANTCTGTIYKASGGTSPAVPWSGANLVVGSVGTGTLNFADANNGSFIFTLNGVAGSKVITRQIFASGSTLPAIDYTDLWWNPNESGWGVALTQQYGIIFATWYAYDSSGKAIWYVASNCAVSGSGCSGDLYQVTGGSPLTSVWNASRIVVSKVGSVTYAFTDASNGSMSYTLNGVTRSRAITRQQF